MHNSRKVFLLENEPRCVLGAYEAGENPPLSEFKTFDGDIGVGDLVIVQSDTRHKMTVVKIAQVDIEPNLDSGSVMHWVVGKVDVDAFNETIKSESKFLDAARRAEKARRKEQLRKDFLQDVDDSSLKISGPNN